MIFKHKMYHFNILKLYFIVHPFKNFRTDNIYNFRNIVPFLKKYGINPVTGEVNQAYFIISLQYCIVFSFFVWLMQQGLYIVFELLCMQLLFYRNSVQKNWSSWISTRMEMVTINFRYRNNLSLSKNEKFDILFRQF